MNRLSSLLSGLLLMSALVAGNVLAGEPTPQAGPPMPAWEQLTPAQRDALVAPLRERWNSNPGERARIYEHAQRWRTMTPEQRARARHGLHRWERMDPARREQMRALFERMRALEPDQRRVLREQWHAMTPEQRRTWVQAHPPSGD